MACRNWTKARLENPAHFRHSMSPRTPSKVRLRQKEQRAAFLSALRKEGYVARACKAGGISRDTAYRWKRTDKRFLWQWNRALELMVEDAERDAEAMERRAQAAEAHGMGSWWWRR